MYYINSIGTAFGPNNIDNSILTSLGHKLDDQVKVTKRSTILNLDYLINYKNSNIAEARLNSSITSAQLAKLSFERALNQTSLSTESIEMLIADTLTPWQMTPSESQRIACELNLKISSFDVGTSGAGLPVILNYVANLKPQRAPKQFVVTIVNAPSINLDYSKASLATQVFSDVAVSLVFTQENSGLELISSVVLAGDHKARFTFSTTEECVEQSGVTLETLKLFCRDNFLQAFQRITSKLDSSKPVTICASDFGTHFFDELKPQLEVKNTNYLDIVGNYGEGLNATPGVGLELWNKEAKSGDQFLGFNPGLGQQYGMFLVRKN